MLGLVLGLALVEWLVLGWVSVRADKTVRVRVSVRFSVIITVSVGVVYPC